jgi:EAL domain-containing protein (putative c-di-GMP-specific phosphodiesterase class I)
MLLEQGLLKAMSSKSFACSNQPMTDLADGHRRPGGPDPLAASQPWHDIPGPFHSGGRGVRLIEPLGEWVMRTACRQGQWLAEGLAVPRSPVNVSVRRCVPTTWSG